MSGSPRPTWTVAFFRRDRVAAPAWWTRFLHPDFAHVAACRSEAEGITLVVNHAGRWLEHAVLPETLAAVRRLFVAQGAAVMVQAQEAEAPAGAMLRGPMTCTEAVKALLGIRAPHVITPRQLHRHLLARGARPIPFQKLEPLP